MKHGYAYTWDDLLHHRQMFFRLGAATGFILSGLIILFATLISEIPLCFG